VILLGVLSSVSSGTYLAVMIVTAFLIGYRFRRYWKPVVAICILGIVIVDIISNRNWYHVMSDFTLNSRTAWYRGRLVEVAIFEGGMSGRWVAGYGYGQEPGWGARIDGRELHRYGEPLPAGAGAKRADRVCPVCPDECLGGQAPDPGVEPGADGGGPVHCLGIECGVFCAGPVELFGVAGGAAFDGLFFDDRPGGGAAGDDAAETPAGSGVAGTQADICKTSGERHMIDLSVILVNWNTRQILQDCLESVYRQTEGLSFEVFVVDNASTDGSADMVRQQFPQVRLIENETNRGFAAANNQAIAAGCGRFSPAAQQRYGGAG
jgi:hypothetical protein